MTDTSRERRLSSAFVMLADTLISAYDLVDLLHTLMDECLELLDVEAAGLLLISGRGELELVASTSERADFVEVLQLDAGAGPCVESFTTAAAVSLADVDEAPEAWSQFRAAAVLQGFHSAHAVPLRLRADVIGAMGLFRRSSGVLSPADAALAQALADVATIGILQERLIRERGIVTEQLQHALDSRIVIEQAKGVVAESAGVEMDAAFAMLRAHARGHNRSLRSVAEDVVARGLPASALSDTAGREPTRSRARPSTP